MRCSLPSGRLSGPLPQLTDQRARPAWEAELRELLMSQFEALGQAGPETDMILMGLGHNGASTMPPKQGTSDPRMLHCPEWTPVTAFPGHLGTETFVCLCAQR